MNIVNLSSHNLSTYEVDVLMKGLGFCPNENFCKFDLVKDLNLFVRKLLLKNMYDRNFNATSQLSREEDKTLEQLVSLLEENDKLDLIDCIDIDKLLADVDVVSNEKTIKPKSTLKKKSDQFPAPSSNPNAATFLKLVSRDLNKIPLKANPKDNMTHLEKQALKDSSKNYSLVIKPSDKGGNIVVMDNDQYVAMCNKILQNENWYRPIPTHMIESFNAKFYDLVDTAGTRGIITATT